MTHDHCPACAVARELRLHRDATYPTWGKSRAALNFAAIVADRECPDYRPERVARAALDEEATA